MPIKNMLNLSEEYVLKNKGTLLSMGAFRNVSEYKKDSSLVLKEVRLDSIITSLQCISHNFNEIELWKNSKDDLKKFLCPIVWWSEGKEFLLMKKAKDIFKDFTAYKINEYVSHDSEIWKKYMNFESSYPKNILKDFSFDNIGMYENKIVFRDYGDCDYKLT